MRQMRELRALGLAIVQRHGPHGTDSNDPRPPEGPRMAIVTTLGLPVMIVAVAVAWAMRH